MSQINQHIVSLYKTWRADSLFGDMTACLIIVKVSEIFLSVCPAIKQEPTQDILYKTDSEFDLHIQTLSSRDSLFLSNLLRFIIQCVFRCVVASCGLEFDRCNKRKTVTEMWQGNCFREKKQVPDFVIVCEIESTEQAARNVDKLQRSTSEQYLQPRQVHFLHHPHPLQSVTSL